MVQQLSKSKFISVITKVNPNNEKESKTRHFFHETFSNRTSYLFYKKILKYFNEFQYQND